MAIRNTVSIEFTVGGPGMAQLAAIEARLRGLGSSSGGIGAATAAMNRFGQAGHSGVGRVTSAMHGFSSATGKAAGGLQRIGEIAAGSLGGNVLAGIFTSAAAAASNFAREAVGAALAAEQAMTQLRTQSRLAGVDLQANIELAKQVAKEFKVSDKDALGLVGSATRAAAAAGRPEDTLKFLRSAADLAAAAGRPMSELNEIVRQLGSANPEPVLDKIAGGTNPSAIFDAFAKSIGTTADKLTTAQEKLAIFSFVMAEANKVQGTAAESMNTTTGRISALSASYDNLQQRVGDAIVKSDLFKRTLELIEKAAAGANLPEFTKNIDGIGSALGRVAQAGAIVVGSVALIGNAFRTLFDVIFAGLNLTFTGFETLRTVMAASIKLGAAEAIRGLQAVLPASVLAAIGLGGVNVAALEGKASSDLTGAVTKFAEVGKATSKILGEDLARFKTILDTTEAAVRAFNGGGTNAVVEAQQAGVKRDPFAASPAELDAFRKSTAGGFSANLKLKEGFGVTAADFALVPVTIETPDGLTSELQLQRVVKEQVAASADLTAATTALTGIMEEVKANPLLGKIIVEAGPSTIIKSAVPVGGASSP